MQLEGHRTIALAQHSALNSMRKSHDCGESLLLGVCVCEIIHTDKNPERLRHLIGVLVVAYDAAVSAT